MVDADVVTVEGTGFSPSSTVQFCQGVVEGTPDGTDCRAPLQGTVVNEAGEFSATYTVQRFITGFFGPVMRDCAQPSANCAMHFLMPDGSGLGQVAIIFAPQAPVPDAIFGTVTDSDGAPVAGVGVSAYTTSNTWVGSLPTTTGADGTYALDGVGTGVSYRIVFLRPAGSPLVSEWFDDAPRRRLATVITVADGTEFIQADAQLSEGSAISGSVTGTQGNPIAGVAVWAFGTGDRWVGSYAATTQADGSYLLLGVRSDTFRIRFVPPGGSGLATEWWDDAPNRGSADVFDVPIETTVTDIDAVLEPNP